jgi:hypothetical protein
MEDSAITAALVGAVLALGKAIEKGMQRANGGSVEYRLTLLEGQVSEMKTAFYEFREESRIRWAKQGDDND